MGENMDKDGTFVLALVGLSNHDLALFKSIAKLSSVRQPSYRVAETEDRAAADIFVINGDDLFAVREGENLMGERPARRVNVCKQLKGASDIPTLLQPLNAKRVIDTLDELTKA